MSNTVAHSTVPPILRQCLYCGRSVPESALSLEHIFPQGLGGNVSPELFKTRDVCTRCNGICGLFVDGAFLKGWLVTNDKALAARRYLDIESVDAIEPLIYLGNLKSIEVSSDEVCELWIGPCGARCYHFHAKDEAQFDSYSGGDPIKRKKKNGRAFLFLTSSNLRWNALAVRSFVKHFARDDRYAGNFVIPDDLPEKPMFRVAAGDAVEDLAKLQVLGDNEHQVGVVVEDGYAQRFIAKMCLGIGFNLFGEAFLVTEYSRLLRSALWEMNVRIREKIPIRGTGYLNAEDHGGICKVAWPGAITQILSVSAGTFVVTMLFPSGRSIHAVLADKEELWSGCEFDKYRDGQVYVVVPGQNLYLGPFPLSDYLSHCAGSGVIEELDDLERLARDQNAFPPC